MEKEIKVNEQEVKAAVFDYIMSKVIDEDFDRVAAVARDVLDIILKSGK